MFDQPPDPRVRGNFIGASAPISDASRIKCGDLFAGAGGFSLAAMNLGLDVRFAVENDRHAANTYETNLVRDGFPELYKRNISYLKPEVVERDCFADGETCDLILGGPPCQGFSVHRINNAGKNDRRNKLIHQYFKFVRHFRPKAFIMENVPGILWERHEAFLKRFYTEAADAGYVLHDPVSLEAADFGVPQKRKRIFILGVRNDVQLSVTWPVVGGYARKPKKSEELKSWLTASEVFKAPLSSEDTNNVHMNHGDALIAAFKKTPLNGGSRHQSGRVLKCHTKHDGHKDVYGRIDPDKPGPTMTTACINPSKGRFVHPTEHHGITVRHAARFQTFPDTFIFTGGLIASGVQIGNAVPILLGEAILAEIAGALLAYKNENEVD